MAGWKHSTCKQEGGDDGYCYVIRDKRTGKVLLNGLHRSECKYYRDRHEQEVNSYTEERSKLADKAISDPINLTKEEVAKLYKGMPLVAQGVWENVLALKQQAVAKGKL